MLCRDLIERLFNNYLFPELSENSDGLITPKIPLMHNETRDELYNILLLLCKEPSNYERVVDLLDDLIPQGKSLISLFRTC
jgi:ubiquitin carboxyl-terminal hydrolase 34